MLKRTRISHTIDTGRSGEALARPGMDPRVWVSLAVVRKLSVDPAHGVFVDVVLMPSGLDETARVGADYAGAGFGFYTPLEEDDELLVGAPSGDPDQGLVVLRRLWSAADKPPADAANHPADALLILKDGATVRLVTQGAGNLVIDPRGSGEVRLGAEIGLSRCAREGDSINVSLSDLQASLDLRYKQLDIPAPLTLPVGGSITSGSDKVKVK